MPSVFLSYSREDLALIEQLEARLKASSPNISIWRDQEKIYAGEKWPKRLGEAIADQDVFLLAWSRNSAASHFVEFEWCTAIALKKTIVPCLLDDAELTSSLKTFHGYRLVDITELSSSLRAASLADAQRRNSVIASLATVTATDGETVLKQTKTIFFQQQWTVQGNVYQSAGDINIYNASSEPSAPEKAKPLVEKWQAWASLVVAILTAVGLFLNLPVKHSEPPPPTVPLQQPSVPFEQELAGTVLDEATGEPLQGVIISLPDFDMIKTTEAAGHFQFRVTKERQARIKFTAQKNGYKSYTNYATLGNTDLRFPMEKGE
jgi:TIR domain